MSTALEAWGKSKTVGDAADSDAAVAEHEILGDKSHYESMEHRADGNAEHRAGQEEPEAVAEDDADALALKKKKGMRVIYGAAGGAVLLLVAVVGLKVAGSRQAPEEQMTPVAQAFQQAPAQDLAIAPIGVRGPAQPVLTERADGTPLAPIATASAVDFGLPASPSASMVAPVVAVAPATAVQSIQMPVPAPMQQVAQAVATAPMQTPVVQAPVIEQPLKAAVLAKAAAPVVDTSARADAEKLRSEVGSLRAELEAKDKAVRELRGELAAVRAQLAKPAAPATSVAAPARLAARLPRAAANRPEVAEPKAFERPADKPAAITETVTPIAPPVQTSAKGKVRSDFRIYASVDGRVWVVGPDGEPTQIAAKSPLADGSRVTSIDSDKNVVYTTAGEIR